MSIGRGLNKEGRVDSIMITWEESMPRTQKYSFAAYRLLHRLARVKPHPHKKKA